MSGNHESTLGPMLFDPVYKDYPWGGRTLERYGRKLPPGIVAESWDVAAHPNGSSIVRNGPMAGKSLSEVFAQAGVDLVGERNRTAVERGRFPLLIKLLDANEWLSVQVHPDDGYAMVHEGEPGKTEMWVVLEAREDAHLIYGFSEPRSRATYAADIAAGTSDAPLHRMTVKRGDVIFVAPGTVHALGPGIVVAEIQQNSDSTYRIHDWGRGRQLHIEKALDVIEFGLVNAEPARPVVLLDDQAMGVEQLVTNRYFEVERLKMPVGGAFFGLAEGETFEVFGVLEGRARLEWDGEPVIAEAVDWVLVPADLGEFQVVAEADSTLLRVFVVDEP
jgi:mannose-6-phosphate isomerase